MLKPLHILSPEVAEFWKFIAKHKIIPKNQKDRMVATSKAVFYHLDYIDDNYRLCGMTGMTVLLVDRHTTIEQFTKMEPHVGRYLTEGDFEAEKDEWLIQSNS